MHTHIMTTNGLTMTVFELLENIHTKGVCGIVNNAVDLETAKTCIEYAEKYDFMYAAVGFHPENLENIPDNYLEQLAQLSKHKKVVAIGETGLDYHWDIPKDLQKACFLRNRSGFLLTLKCRL